MRKLARLAIDAAALALAAAVVSCGQESPQEPQNQAQPSQSQQHQAPQPQKQQPQKQAQQPQKAQPQQHQPQQGQQAQQREPEPQQPRAQQAPNQPPPGQPSANQNQNAAANPSEGEIRQIQQALEQKGFRVGGVDGRLGPRTRRALSEFQRQQRLRQTGMPDEQTLAALGIGAATTTGQGNNPSAQPQQQPPAGRQ